MENGKGGSRIFCSQTLQNALKEKEECPLLKKREKQKEK
jgi:hypothetical protein